VNDAANVMCACKHEFSLVTGMHVNHDEISLQLISCVFVQDFGRCLFTASSNSSPGRLHSRINIGFCL
jgi:hypothetical protein